MALVLKGDVCGSAYGVCPYSWADARSFDRKLQERFGLNLRFDTEYRNSTPWTVLDDLMAIFRSLTLFEVEYRWSLNKPAHQSMVWRPKSKKALEQQRFRMRREAGQ